LVAGSEAVIFQAPVQKPVHAHLNSKLHGKRMVAMPMAMFRADCSVKSHHAKSQAQFPGAGMTPDTITPFTNVYMDGYYDVDCADDYMFLHGDKFGDNKYEYELGENSNVSIVHYNAHVVAEDREPISPDVCFRFCRSVPEMSYFGIRNGNSCYCAPYYRSVEGDDSMCDVVCEGDGMRTCGSKTKSTIFAMHSCQNSADLLTDAAGKMAPVHTDVDTHNSDLDAIAGGMQSAAAAYQAMFSAKGDPVAADLMQAAKVRAGELAAVVVDGNKLITKMNDVAGKVAPGSPLMGADFSDAAKLEEAEGVLENFESLTADGIAADEDLQSHLDEAAPAVAPASVAEQYYSVMYFVDKKEVDMPSTCGGTSSHTPLVGNLSTCAAACDADIHECVGFSYFPKAGSLTAEQGLCFLFSHFKTATYYTQCGSASSAAVDPKEVKCMAKFSKFEGTSLAVDGTGKCKECFTEVTHADRCFV